MKNILLILMLFLANNTLAQTDAQNVLLKTADAMLNKQSLRYDIIYTRKGSDMDDTVVMTGNVHLLRVSSDTLVGGKAWISPRGEDKRVITSYPEGTFMFYDLKHAYKVYPQSKNIIFQNPHVVRNAYLFDLWPRIMMWEYFLKTDKIKKLAGSKYSVTKLKDTVINKQHCYAIMIKPTVIEYSDWHWIWYINKADNMLVCWEQWAPNGGDMQYEHFLITSYHFNDVKDERFSTAQLPADYTRGEIKPD